MKKVYLANDTSTYHGGSFAVIFSIIDSIKESGFDVVIESDKKNIEASLIEECVHVVVNGEGTIHSNKPRARHLLSVLEFAQSRNIPTTLCNTSWFSMNNDFDHVLAKLHQISVRDLLSAETLEQKHGISPEMHIDLSYYYDIKLEEKEQDIRFLATDFYSKEFNCFVRPMGGEMAEVDFLNMRSMSWLETLEQVSRAKVLITGRFHGFMAACKTRTRFVAYPGNTPKIEGVLRWFGNEIGITRDYFQLMRSAKLSHRNANYYNELFNWMAEKKKWNFREQ